GSIGGVAYIFADYASRLFRFGEAVTLLLAVLSILLLTGINILGVTLGKHTQNLLTLLKVMGLGSVILVGLLWGSTVTPLEISPYPVEPGWFATAMILVLWTYSGWHEAAYVVSEVKEPRRNLPRALLLGTAAVTIVYLAFNAGVLLVLGWEGAKTKGFAMLALAQALGEHGAVIMSVLVMVSALGAINGMIFTTARIYSEFGADHRLFRRLGDWSSRWGTPVRALVTQGAISIAFLVGVTGIVNLIAGDDKLLTVRAGFENMIYTTAAVFWLFFLLTGVSLIVLRFKDPDTDRPFRVPLYPVLPILFSACCGYMVYGAATFKPIETLIGFGLLVLGLAFYFLPQKLSAKPAPLPREPEPAGVG
ncbi:MAG: amino acid permease, partial [Gemmataceae bacterium]|nr:amino acid permease [Gemmataceae bacterium]